MELYATVLSYAIPFFILMIGIEALVGYFQGKVVIRSYDTISSISSGLTNSVKDVLGLVVIIVSYGFMADHFALFSIKSTWLLYVIAFIGVDFAGYWVHRFEHVFNLFWNRHIIHHSSEEFNLACALRQNVSVFFAIFFFLYIPLAIIGIPKSVIEIVAPLHLFAQFWYHTTVIKKMGFLESILVTPSHHRVHHAINDAYMDRNFSQVFIIWDKFFGTFQEELPDDPPIYGVRRQVETWNPIKINFQHLLLLLKDAWRAEKWKDKFTIWFKPTGWRPLDVEGKYPVEYTKIPQEQVKYDTRGSKFLEVWFWLQLIVHLVLLLHFFSILPHYTFPFLLAYGVFMWVSIYAYTSMMDGSKDALFAESLKFAIALGFLKLSGGWFPVQGEQFSWGWIMITYLLISITITIYHFALDKAPKRITKNIQHN